ncbi:uncharacterized protein [Acropora muricata]|uniref:uncharacterized protein isoform X2 n=1 Tax=Acropora muricata TaxID=159855 RepID=UPI0034E59811
MKKEIILFLTAIILVLSRMNAHGKPALNEENRNLCEDEPDKAECIREVEEAKGNHDSTEQQGDSILNCDVMNLPNQMQTPGEALWKNT